MNKRARADHWTVKAKKEGYPARSVYKLEEMDRRFRLFRPGDRVLDLGAAPGSWSLYVCRRLKDRGKVVGVDLKPLSLPRVPDSLIFRRGDIFAPDTRVFLTDHGPYDAVICDAAPSTTGNRLTDARRSHDLVESVLDLIPGLLAPRGRLVLKVFMGGDEKELLDRIRGSFAEARSFKPRAVRSESFETYFVGLGYHGDDEAGIREERPAARPF